MTGEVRFGKQAETGHSARAGKFMPAGFFYSVQGHAGNQAVEQVRELRLVAQGFLVATVRFNHPFAA